MIQSNAMCCSIDDELTFKEEGNPFLCLWKCLPDSFSAIQKYLSTRVKYFGSWCSEEYVLGLCYTLHRSSSTGVYETYCSNLEVRACGSARPLLLGDKWCCLFSMSGESTAFTLFGDFMSRCVLLICRNFLSSIRVPHAQSQLDASNT